jgi:shikimate kinase
MAPRRGYGVAHAAVGLLNAIATGGYGAAAGLGLWLRARVSASTSYRGRSHTRGETLPIEPGILEAVDRTVAEWLSEAPLGGLEATVWSSIPLEAGLKGSSALVNALAEAVLRLRGHAPPPLPVLARLGVEAARRAGLTVTGALDDHLAVSGCGAYATDNRRQAVLARPRLPQARYAAIAAPGRRSIRTVGRHTYARLRGAALAALRLLLEGHAAEAALLNGLTVAEAAGLPGGLLLEATGLPGVAAAGVSGKGPAVYALAADEAAAARAARLLAARLGAKPLVAPLIHCPGEA